MVGLAGAVWGIAGIMILLGSAVYRLSYLGIEGLSYDFRWYHWLSLIVMVVFMAYAEGYRGFQKGFSPRAAARAKYLRDRPDLYRSFMAPFFCMGYFHATRKRKIVSISLTIGILLLVLHVHYIAQPWRGIIDVGVVTGLAWGMISLAIFSIQAFSSKDFRYSPEVPEENELRSGDHGREIKLIILGSGTCVPSTGRSSPGYFIRAAGRNILIDCGSGTLLQLERSGISFREIDAVIITHTHPDHIGDLLPLLHARKAAPSGGPRQDITLIGPKAVGSYYEDGILSVMSRPESFEVHIKETEEKFMVGDISISSKETLHSRESYAYRLQLDNRSVVFTGDTDFDETLADLARDADVLIADCSYPDDNKVPGHMTPGECGRLAEKACVKRLVLSHLYPSEVQYSEYVDQAGRFFKGDIIIAEDLMEFYL